MTGLSAQDRLERLVVEAVSPDAALRLVIRPGQEVSVSISAQAYRHYPDAARLEQQWEAVLDQGFTVWTRTRRELLRETRERRRPTSAPAKPSRIDRDAEKITVTSATPNAWVRLSATALTRWKVELAQDALTTLTAPRLADEMVQAIARVRAGYDRALRRLRARHLD